MFAIGGAIYLESLVKPGSTRLSILVDNSQKPGKVWFNQGLPVSPDF